MRNITNVDLAGKRVVIRVDFNVPIQDGKVTNTKRICASLPTIHFALNQGASVILLSHWGRPTEGKYDAAYSLQPLVAPLSHLLALPVRFATDWLAGLTLTPGEVVLCENVRFQPGETADDAVLAQRMATLGDVFVMDAFATAHRAQASTHGIARYAPCACAGLLLMREMQALDQALATPKRPIVAIVGGAKVSTKLNILQAVLQKVDTLIVGGGIANTFLAATGQAIGQSLHEAELIPAATQLLHNAAQQGKHILLPSDVVTATTFSATALPYIKTVAQVQAQDLILDTGPDSNRRIAACLQQAGTIIWNGPMGVFEFAAFAEGTRSLAQAIAASSAFSLAGGGDTLAAIDAFDVSQGISYISTGGGAFLEYLEGQSLPGLRVLDAAV